jgi:hypothetical protein
MIFMFKDGANVPLPLRIHLPGLDRPIFCSAAAAQEEGT